MVGSEGFEPPILRTPGADPTKLDHEPILLTYLILSVIKSPIRGELDLF